VVIIAPCLTRRLNTMMQDMDATQFVRALGDMNKEAQDVLIDMHRIMITLLGVLFTLVAIIIVVIFAIKPRFAVILRWVMLFLCAWQIGICIFFWFNPQWPVALQLIAFALFGIFALITANSEHLLIFLLLTFFDFFVLIGKMTWLGYDKANFLDALDATSCLAYYNHNETTQCAGYLSFLRFLAFGLIVSQPVQVFFTYLVYKLRKEEDPEPLVQNDYGKIADTSSSSSSQPEAQ